MSYSERNHLLRLREVKESQVPISWSYMSSFLSQETDNASLITLPTQYMPGHGTSVTRVVGVNYGIVKTGPQYSELLFIGVRLSQ